VNRSLPLAGVAGIRQWIADDTLLKRVLTAQRWMVRAYFEARYVVADPWHLATSAYERERARTTLAVLEGRRYPDAIDVGCGEGIFTAQLLSRCDRIVAVDFSSLAIRRARRRFADDTRVEVRHLDIRSEPLDRSFDLVVCAELFYYFSRPEFEAVGGGLVGLVAPGGDLCLVHGTSVHDAALATGKTAPPGSMSAAAIHDWFGRTRRLAVVRDVVRPRYRITLLRRTQAPRG
jgi:SAM-dependent methyltransferase